jgi:hypothetical protein
LPATGFTTGTAERVLRIIASHRWRQAIRRRAL